MTSLVKRGAMYQFSSTLGGRRLRCSLGTSNPDSAKCLIRQISAGLAEGPKSEHWVALSKILPPQSFQVLASHVGVSALPEIGEFEKQFYQKLYRRLELGEIAETTQNLYEKTAERFFARMKELGVRKMDEISSEVIEEYLLFRKRNLLDKGKSGRGLQTECSVLAIIFDLAAQQGLVQKSPLLHRYKAEVDVRGAKPFTAEEIERLEAAAKGELWIIYCMCRWTGMRGSDVVDVNWGAVDWNEKTIFWKTRKRSKFVRIPLHSELFECLKSAYHDQPATESILGISRSRLYHLVRKLGEKAGISDCHPHRFRAHLATEMLGKGASLWDVAQLLGDSTATIEAHYGHVSSGQQQRVRSIMEAA